MKTLVHYTNGYGGNLNYFTLCQKEITSQSEEELATINPLIVTCKECKDTEAWKTDFNDINNLDPIYKRRIFIGSDIIHASEIAQAQRYVKGFLKSNVEPLYVRRVFTEILDFAWHNLEKTWEAVKKADEIYASTSLVPLIGGSYSGAPVIFNGMCERAIKENITGKDVYILNELSNIEWDMIDIPVMKKAFKHNNLWMWDEDYNFVKVDIKKINK